MRKNIVVLILFFVVISLSLSTLMGNFDLFIDSISGKEFVRIELEKVDDIDALIKSLKQIEEFSNNKIEYSGEKGNYIVDVKDSNVSVSVEIGKVLRGSENDDALVNDYNVFSPSKDKSNLILIYMGLILVLIFGLLGAYRQVVKIKNKARAKS